MARKTVQSVANTLALIVLSLSLIGAIGFPGKLSGRTPFRPLDGGTSPAWNLPGVPPSPGLPAGAFFNVPPVVPSETVQGPLRPAASLLLPGIMRSTPPAPPASAREAIPVGRIEPSPVEPPVVRAPDPTVTFQQGDANGYSGAVDTYVYAGAPTADNSAVVLLTTDYVPPP